MSRGKHRNEYSEIDDIKSDLQSLKSNVVALTQHLKANGTDHLVDLEGRAVKTVSRLKVQGAEQYKVMESHVRDNPGQAVMIAFAGGLLASLLLNGRRS